MTRPDTDRIGRDYLCLLSPHLPVSLALLSYQSHDGILMPPWVNCPGVFLQASFGVPRSGTVSPWTLYLSGKCYSDGRIILTYM
jgi:hypothetical protein